MDFNLKQYINKKYLTEKVQSDILINELLQDNMFKYYKVARNNNSYSKLLKIYEQLIKIIKSFYYEFSFLFDLKDTFRYNEEKITTDELKKALYNKYMSLYNEYIKRITTIFDKPDPMIFSTILTKDHKDNTFYISNHVDLFNLSDDMFVKYSLNDLKNNKSLKQEIDKFINNNLVFYITNIDKKIQACSCEGYIILYALDNPMYKNYFTNNVYDYLDKHVKKNNVVINTINYKLSDGEELTLPLVKSYSSLNNNKPVAGVEYISKMLDLSNIDYLPKKEKVGKINSKASHLCKNTSWGNDSNDYIIIYTPNKSFVDKTTGEYKSTINNGNKFLYHLDGEKYGYNDIVSNKTLVNRKNQQRKDFFEQENKTYKWVKDLLGKYKPYAGGKQNKLWYYCNKLKDYDYETLYGDDEYNNKLVKKTHDRYMLLVQLLKLIKNFDIYKNKLKNYIIDILYYLSTGKQYLMKIRKLFNVDNELYKSLMILYTTYMNTLNVIMSYYNKIQLILKEADNFRDIKNIRKNYNYSYYNDLDIKNKIKTLETEINNNFNLMEPFKNQIEELKNKIDETI